MSTAPLHSSASNRSSSSSECAGMFPVRCWEVQRRVSWGVRLQCVIYQLVNVDASVIFVTLDFLSRSERTTFPMNRMMAGASFSPAFAAALALVLGLVLGTPSRAARRQWLFCSSSPNLAFERPESLLPSYLILVGPRKVAVCRVPVCLCRCLCVYMSVCLYVCGCGCVGVWLGGTHARAKAHRFAARIAIIPICCVNGPYGTG